MKAILRSALFVIASVSLAIAQGTFTTIDYPGADSTSVFGVNSNGDLVGEYFDTAGQHGFLRSQGVFTTIDVPGTTSTGVTGINDLGQLVGVDSAGDGFIYDRNTQAFTILRYPGSQLTSPAGINNAGVIVGTIQQASPFTDNAFILQNGQFAVIAVKGSQSSFATGINGNGDIVGDFMDSSGAYESFVLSTGELRKLGVPGVPSAIIIGMNDNNVAVGVYEPSSGMVPQAGFVYSGKKFQGLVIFHRTAFSYAACVNDSGIVAGYYVGVDGNSHGFVWTPSSDTTISRSL